MPARPEKTHGLPRVENAAASAAHYDLFTGAGGIDASLEFDRSVDRRIKNNDPVDVQSGSLNGRLDRIEQFAEVARPGYRRDDIENGHNPSNLSPDGGVEKPGISATLLNVPSAFAHLVLLFPLCQTAAWLQTTIFMPTSSTRRLKS